MGVHQVTTHRPVDRRWLVAAWLTSNLCPARLQPQDAYGLEKLATEELCKHYAQDFGMECR